MTVDAIIDSLSADQNVEDAIRAILRALTAVDLLAPAHQAEVDRLTERQAIRDRTYEDDDELARGWLPATQPNTVAIACGDQASDDLNVLAALAREYLK